MSADRLPAWAHRIRDLVGSADPADLSDVPSAPSHRPAAVLIAFGRGRTGEGELLLTQRAAHLRKHPGQVSFPGGSLEPGETPVQAALRETCEETGLHRTEVRVWGELPSVPLPVTSFTVTPVLAWWPQPRDLGWDPGETERAVRVPLPELLDPANRFCTRHRDRVGPGFETSGLFIWGFTAGLLARVFDLSGLTRDWDRRRFRQIPPDLRRPSPP